MGLVGRARGRRKRCIVELKCQAKEENSKKQLYAEYSVLHFPLFIPTCLPTHYLNKCHIYGNQELTT